MKKKKIVILGSTGSVGENVVKVAEYLPDEIEVYGIAAGRNAARLSEQAFELGCSYAVVGDNRQFDSLRNNLPDTCKALSGPEGMLELVTRPEVDIVVCSIVGTGGLIPVLEAMKAGKNIAIASKEVLVAAGELVMNEAEKNGVDFLPMDSEHSAVFQCLEGRRHREVARIILTASGGPFRETPLEEMEKADYKTALLHPVWNMGPKVTIDSATLMNKGLEVIEARWLFDVSPNAIDILIHPQSVIHSMVEFVDGTVLAQMSEPDMRFPIQYALTYPHKIPGSLHPMDFSKISEMTFEEPDHKKFPALKLAYEAIKKCGTMPAVLNAANEAAVERFRKGEIKLTDIVKIVEKVMESHNSLEHPSLEAILSAHEWAVRKAMEIQLRSES